MLRIVPVQIIAGLRPGLAGSRWDPIEVRILLDGCDENVAITALKLYVR